ncbi:MAG: hypothetical protein JWO52_5727 [Gammaproteobacteria bacterium]|jgi:GntR family transcriptional repressor for pyruvate dehydrogenase complex|nr:hypothetical protein [Gammaproteobacteria bacterium]
MGSKRKRVSDGSTAVKRATKALRTMSLKAAPGAFLGTEQDLLAGLDVSRPTFRQASVLLAQEQVLSIKRGVGGGYFSSRPSSKAVTHMAAVFLRSKSANLVQIMRAVGPIWKQQVSLAARSQNEDARAKLAMLMGVDSQRSMKKLGSGTFSLEEYLDYLRSERELSSCIAALSGDSVLSLFQDILNDFCATLPRAEDVFRQDPGRVVEYSTVRRRMMEAILEKDERIARILAGRCAQMQLNWLRREVSKDDKQPPAVELDGAPAIGGESKPRSKKRAAELRSARNATNPVDIVR